MIVHAREENVRLKALLGKEREATVQFVLKLMAFDGERLWEALGYASLWDYLHRELRLPESEAFYRSKAVRLFREYPELIEHLRDGRIAMSALPEVAKVVTPENREQVLPQFLDLSVRKAKELAANLSPASEPPRRAVITKVAREPLQTFEVRAPEPSGSMDPVGREQFRLHCPVTKRYIEKLEAAKAGESHRLPHAKPEEILEAALDALLEKQTKRKALVKKPRASSRGETKSVPASVKRAVWQRDGGRCQWGLDAGGICGGEPKIGL